MTLSQLNCVKFVWNAVQWNENNDFVAFTKIKPLQGIPHLIFLVRTAFIWFCVIFDLNRIILSSVMHRTRRPCLNDVITQHGNGKRCERLITAQQLVSRLFFSVCLLSTFQNLKEQQWKWCFILQMTRRKWLNESLNQSRPVINHSVPHQPSLW